MPGCRRHIVKACTGHGTAIFLSGRDSGRDNPVQNGTNPEIVQRRDRLESTEGVVVAQGFAPNPV